MSTRPTLPDPGRAENGAVACNAPLIVNGTTVGYCNIYVRVYRDGSRKPHRRKPHRRKPHRVEWRADT